MAKNELVSLALLTIAPLHAYALNALLEEMQVEEWAQISRTSIYATLKRLEVSGAIEVQLQKVDNMPERKVFSLTTEGRALLAVEMEQALTTIEKTGTTLFHLAINLFMGLPAEKGRIWATKRLTLLQEYKSSQEHVRQALIEGGITSAALSVTAALGHIDVEIGVTKDFISLLTTEPHYYEGLATTCARSLKKPKKEKK